MTPTPEQIEAELASADVLCSSLFYASTRYVVAVGMATARLEGEAKGREEIERLTRERDEKAADCETHYAQEEWLRKKMQRLELDRADALTKKERLWAALLRWRNYGCPDCGGDCSSANPPIIGCIMRETEDALKGQKHDKAT